MIPLTPIKLSSSLGPVHVPGARRQQYTHADPETCSLTDRVVQDTASPLKLTFNDYIHPNYETIINSPARPALVEEYREMIEEHFESRVNFFFQQLIVCYETNLRFENAGAAAQGKSALPIVQSIDKKRTEIPRQAAHSSTNPCLIAFESENPRGRIYLQGTDYYKMQNATVNMPKWMNDADREIDEKTKTSLLRTKSLKIINDASSGKTSPQDGVKQFLIDALVEVKAAILRVGTIEEKSKTKRVLRLYEEVIVNIQARIEKDSGFFERLLNIKPITDDKIKSLAIKIRYCAIRNSQIKQAALIEKIEAVKAVILKTIAKPTNFNTAFRSILVDSVSCQVNKQRLEKLLNFTPDHFTAQQPKNQITLYNKARALLSVEPTKKKIDALAKILIEEMGQMRIDDFNERGGLIKLLRNAKEWTQKELAGFVNQMHPDEKLTPQKISIFERGERFFTKKIGKRICESLEVDSTVLYPKFFYC